MSRIQLALNVSNLDEAIAFYSKLFAVEPAKRRSGYANFVVSDPPLKLVLMETSQRQETLNHLGIEMNSSEEVKAIDARLQAEGLSTRVQEQVTCCHAVQDKTWVKDPDGEPWEVYAVLQNA